MDRFQVRLLNRGQARRAFFTDNAADFPADSPGGRVAEAMDVVIASIQTQAATQSSGAVSRSVEIKNENFFNLKRLMRKMNRAANSMGEDIEGFEELFRLPRSQAEEAWLAAGRAFHADSAANEAGFFEYDLPENFRRDLQNLINAMDTASTDKDISEERRGGATGKLDADFKELGKLGRKANNIVLNKYEDDPQKLAAWAIASHLERAPQRAEEETEEENKDENTPTG